MRWSGLSPVAGQRGGRSVRGIEAVGVHVEGKARGAGFDGLREVSRRPRTSQARLPAEVEVLVCELRRAHPRWVPGGSRSRWPSGELRDGAADDPRP
jgi:hypothetical protein